MRIDFHSHILPGADHGSDSVDMSLKQIQILKQSGFDIIVATSHFYPQRHSVEQFLKIREKSTKELVESLCDNSPEIYLGAEILVCAGLDRMKNLEHLCINGTSTLLLEMPLTSKWSEELYETVHNITNLGFDTVLAHIDRYPSDNVLRLLDETNAKAQINLSSFGHLLKRKKIQSYIETGRVVAVGSDIHGTDDSCIKDLASFVKHKAADPERIFCETEKCLTGAKKINK